MGRVNPHGMQVWGRLNFLQGRDGVGLTCCGCEQVCRQDLAAGGTKNQKGPKAKRGATFKKYSIGCM